MSNLPKILIFSRDGASAKAIAGAVDGRFEAVQADSMERALEQLRLGGIEGLCLLEENTDLLSAASLLPDSGGILAQLDDGVALLDLNLRVVWCNRRLQELSGVGGALVGKLYSELFDSSVLPGADPTPFHTAMETRVSARTQLRKGENKYLQVHATPVTRAGGSEIAHFVVMVRDITSDTLRQRKLSAIFEAGLELGDMAPEDLREMSVENRVELLKMQIVNCTEGVLQYETVEIRLLDAATKVLHPLLNVGMLPEAAARVLMAHPEGNGVTGFVASTGQSYLCADSEHDPRYIKGAAGARSSLTVPLKWHDHILGTFNVESRQPGAFSQQDLQFLELFGLEVAVALNRLNLLTAERIGTAAENTGKILCEVAQPVDDVLNDAAWILDKYIGHDPEVVQRLQQILKHARDIKQCIQRTREEIA
ncbi:MAG: GAF domain-containing protein, partial [Planctomycetota bacterium]|nr:GAF domain-containing protein [Planctomycetota bacterium]